MQGCFSRAGKTQCNLQSVLSFEDKHFWNVLQAPKIPFSVNTIDRNQLVPFFIELVDVITMFQVDLNMILMQHWKELSLIRYNELFISSTSLKKCHLDLDYTDMK